MKVLAINGSPHASGNTSLALGLVSAELEERGIEVERLDLGVRPIRGCIGCGQCAKRKDGTCALPDDGLNEAVARMREADGLLLGSPVHYASISGSMKCLLDRAFYVAGSCGGLFRHKVGASLVALRRSGGMTAIDQLNRYLQYAEIFMPTSNYWAIIHGAAPGEAAKDEEGCQIMRVLGKNLAWLLEQRMRPEAAADLPEKETKVRMNFIR